MSSITASIIDPTVAGLDEWSQLRVNSTKLSVTHLERCRAGICHMSAQKLSEYRGAVWRITRCMGRTSRKHLVGIEISSERAPCSCTTTARFPLTTPGASMLWESVNAAATGSALPCRDVSATVIGTLAVSGFTPTPVGTSLDGEGRVVGVAVHPYACRDVSMFTPVMIALHDSPLRL